MKEKTIFEKEWFWLLVVVILTPIANQLESGGTWQSVNWASTVGVILMGVSRVIGKSLQDQAKIAKGPAIRVPMLQTSYPKMAYAPAPQPQTYRPPNPPSQVPPQPPPPMMPPPPPPVPHAPQPGQPLQPRQPVQPGTTPNMAEEIARLEQLKNITAESIKAQATEGEGRIVGRDGA